MHLTSDGAIISVSFATIRFVSSSHQGLKLQVKFLSVSYGKRQRIRRLDYWLTFYDILCL